MSNEEATSKKKSNDIGGMGIMCVSTYIATGLITVICIAASIPLCKWYAGLIGKSIAKELKA